MFMPKKPLSVTLDEGNLLWLHGRAASTKRRSLSEALDALITAARAGGVGADAVRSVAGTVDIAEDDPDLLLADNYMNAAFAASVDGPFIAREQAPAYPAKKGKPRG
jgi:hypothetical protein